MPDGGEQADAAGDEELHVSSPLTGATRHPPASGQALALERMRAPRGGSALRTRLDARDLAQGQHHGADHGQEHAEVERHRGGELERSRPPAAWT